MAYGVSGDRAWWWVLAGLAALAAFAYLALTAAEYVRAVGLHALRDQIQGRRKKRLQRLEKLGEPTHALDKLEKLSPEELAQRVRARVLAQPEKGAPSKPATS